MSAVIQESTLDATDARIIRAYVDDLIAAGINPARIAVEADVSAQRLKAWLNGSGGENILPALAAWKAESEAAAGLNSGFVLTPTAERIIRAFDRARQGKGGVAHNDDGHTQQRGIALIYGASGAGKSETAEWYQAQQNGTRPIGIWPVVLVRCTGAERNQSALFGSIIDGLKGGGLYRQTHESKLETILNHVQQGGLIVFDEAQLLPLRRMDELRYFPDQCGIAVAFMGNMAGYKELVDAKIGQITSRVGGALVVIDAPCEGDVDALLDAWEIRGRKVREIALMIGTQDGGLRKLADSASFAKVFAKASGKPIDADLFKAAAVAAGAYGNAV